jgi:siroheme synthase
MSFIHTCQRTVSTLSLIFSLPIFLRCSVRFLTGHSRKGGDDPLYVAEQAADPDSTLVIYMGLATLPGPAAKLLAHGLPPDTPAAAIERGTTPQQRLVYLAAPPLIWRLRHILVINSL